MFYRSDNRASEQMRPVKITPNFISIAEGSALIEVGNTRVICTATIDESVPMWMRNSGKGWITSEYEHDGLRASDGAVLDRLIGMVRGTI